MTEIDMTKRITLPCLIETCAILLLSMTSCLGSVVVLVRDPDGTLTGGVDSLATDTNGSGEFVRSWERCKVFRNDSCVVLMAGILSGPGVDLVPLMKRNCASHSDVRQIASSFFSSAMGQIRAAAPPQTLLKSPIVAAVIAPDRNKRRFEAAIIDFGDGVPRKMSGEQRVISYFGLTTTLDSFTRAHPKLTVKGSSEQVVRRLLQVAATAQPAMVGGRFSIFRISSHDGFRWIEAGSCPAE